MISTSIEWEFLLLRTRVHKQIDAKCDKALALIKALGERNRRGIGQLTRYDRITRRIK